MIKLVNKDDDEDLKVIQNIYNEIIEQKKKLKKEFETNPFKIIYCFKEKRNIIGFIEISHIYDRIEIDYIYVLKEYRNKNIASSLIEKIITYGVENKVQNITLEVKVDNKPAVNLYKKYKFTECAIRKGYYNGIDGILMKKEMI